jgi:rhodanese-related sulfurtransferase
MPVTKTVKMLVAEAKEQTNSISPADAQDRQQAGDAILIDIRDIRELQRDGRIDGRVSRTARHAGILGRSREPLPQRHFCDRRRELVLFCASSWRSALAAKTLQDMGLSNIRDMDGGFTAWKTAGLPITKDD